MQDFEKLGLLYLGKIVDPETNALTQDYLVYDAKDLVTHAVCVGMTGSGKTGLCITLLEEAAIDKIPSIIIDPKGDMAISCLPFRICVRKISALGSAKRRLRPKGFHRKSTHGRRQSFGARLLRSGGRMGNASAD